MPTDPKALPARTARTAASGAAPTCGRHSRSVRSSSSSAAVQLRGRGGGRSRRSPRHRAAARRGVTRHGNAGRHSIFGGESRCRRAVAHSAEPGTAVVSAATRSAARAPRGMRPNPSRRTGRGTPKGGKLKRKPSPCNCVKTPEDTVQPGPQSKPDAGAARAQACFTPPVARFHGLRRRASAAPPPPCCARPGWSRASRGSSSRSRG